MLDNHFFKTTSNVTLCATLFCFIAFLLTLIATFTPGWGQFYNSVVQFYFGLFQSCSTSRGCRSNTHEHSGATIAAMVFMFLSFFLTLLGLILMVVSVYEKSPLLMRIAGSFDIVGGIFAICGVSTYTGSLTEFLYLVDGTNFHYSYVLAWVSGLFAWVGGTLALYAAKKGVQHK
ncbi:uncharacterized protein LOC143465659 [Clavelina lepadiformis]|uniref:uncharacterized protein LOC143465659 n=1 Tax=Clavelina lepadiformis TaxID=159417 RepID=UPI004042B8A4